MGLHGGVDSARTPTGVSGLLFGDTLNGTTCESPQPHIALCITLFPSPLIVILLCRLLSFCSTKLVDLGKAGMDSNNNGDKNN